MKTDGRVLSIATLYLLLTFLTAVAFAVTQTTNFHGNASAETISKQQVLAASTAVTPEDNTPSQPVSSPESKYRIMTNALRADFSAMPRVIGVNNTVYFTDLSQGAPSSWSWDFGDTGMSTLQSPSHMYTSEGSYAVSLAISDGATSNTKIMEGYITVYPFPPGNITAVDSAGIVGSFTSIAKGNDGLPIMSYCDSENQNLKVLHCGDASCTKGNTIITVDSNGNVGDYSSIAIGEDGLPIVSYWDGTSDRLKVAHCGNAICSSGNTINPVDSEGYVGLYTSIAIGMDGLPVVSYYDNTNQDLKVAHCGDASCSSGNTITTVDSKGAVGWYSSMVIGDDGLPVISYFDNTNQDLKIAHCGDASCSSYNTITTVDSKGYVGFDSSIAIGADGLPVISYYDGTKGNLKIAKCRDATCARRKSNTITKVDSSGDVGYYTSIAVGTDGLPVVSYFDYTNKDLKVVHCGDASCSSDNIITKVDSEGYVGAYSSIAISTDGMPIVSYYDYTNFDLKVAYCRDAACSVWHVRPESTSPVKY